MQSWITTPQVSELLDTLYADAATTDPLAHQAARASGATDGPEADFYRSPHLAYMAVSRQFGNLLYTLARSSRARTIVEFGTSFGISTIYLAAALRDSGSGCVITSEFNSAKTPRAQANLAAAGLEKWVEFRVGDAQETLRTNLPPEIDLVFLDGAKGLYLDVLKLLEPRLRSGAIIASDNTDHDGMSTFLQYIGNPDHGYTTSAILTARGSHHSGHAITIRS